jgi:hypothetical protein
VLSGSLQHSALDRASAATFCKVDYLISLQLSFFIEICPLRWNKLEKPQHFSARSLGFDRENKESAFHRPASKQISALGANAKILQLALAQLVADRYP